VNGIDEPKGIVYVDIPIQCGLEVDVIKAMQMALGWGPDQSIAASLEEVLQVLSRHAIKYKQEYERVPVLIIDNANRLAQKHQELLDLFQDYAKDAADKGIATVVFVSSEGRVPRHMMGKSIIVFDCHVLIKYYRERFVVKKWTNHRNWRCEQRGSSSVPRTPEGQ
jgi:hypothetical protein